MGRSGASAPAWKSIECPIEPSLTSVTSKTSPTRPCRVGPGATPLKVQRRCHTPGATSSGTSWTVNVTFRTRVSSSGGSTGSTALASVAGSDAGAGRPGGAAGEPWPGS